jgi:hypothetical protein
MEPMTDFVLRSTTDVVPAHGAVPVFYLEFQAGEVTLQSARRGRPPLLGLDDAGDVGGGTRGVLPLEPCRQFQHLGVGARGDLACGRDQRVEPAGPPRPGPAVQTRARHRHRLTGRAHMHPGGHIAHQLSALDR